MMVPLVWCHHIFKNLLTKHYFLIWTKRHCKCKVHLGIVGRAHGNQLVFSAAKAPKGSWLIKFSASESPLNCKHLWHGQSQAGHCQNLWKDTKRVRLTERFNILAPRPNIVEVKTVDTMSKNMVNKYMYRREHTDSYLQNDIIILLRKTTAKGSSAESHWTDLGVTAVREIPDFVPVG